MKYIKELNIDFNNWEEYDEFEEGDTIIPKNKSVLYVYKETDNCIYVTKHDISKLMNTHLQDNYYTIQRICINKDIKYVKLRGHWPWFFADDFTKL